MRFNKRYIAVLVTVLFLASLLIFGRPALKLVLPESQAAADRAERDAEKQGLQTESFQLGPVMQTAGETQTTAPAGPRIWLQDRRSMVADESMRAGDQGTDLTGAQPL